MTEFEETSSDEIMDKIVKFSKLATSEPVAVKAELGPDGKELAMTKAGYAHVDALVARTEADLRHAAPGGNKYGPWHGWAIREAFVAGAEWQESRSAITTPPAAPTAIDVAIEALEPFAEKAGAYDGMPAPKYFGDTDFETRFPDSAKGTVTVGELRRARTALASLKATRETA